MQPLNCVERVSWILFLHLFSTLGCNLQHILLGLKAFLPVPYGPICLWWAPLLMGRLLFSIPLLLYLPLFIPTPYVPISSWWAPLLEAELGGMRKTTVF